MRQRPQRRSGGARRRPPNASRSRRLALAPKQSRSRPWRVLVRGEHARQRLQFACYLSAATGAEVNGSLIGPTGPPAMRPCKIVRTAWLAPVTIGRAGNGNMRGSQRRRPALAQIAEIRLARLDAVDQFGIAYVAPHDHQI